jgi:NAD(P)-dependent dehydrogenase (short-subunit alcohol dehydrogenase family)
MAGTPVTGQLAGETAVITGGASGIGQACAEELAARGARVVIADIDLPAAKAVAVALPGEGHGHVGIDVTDEGAVTAAAAAVEAEYGTVSILVTSAGITQRPVPPHELDIDRWDAVMRTNVRGTWLTAVAFGMPMVRRRRGCVVTVASVTGLASTPLHSYGSGKAAVIAMTANLASEWGRAGVRVNGVAPGYTRTPLLQSLIDSGERDPSVIEEATALRRLVEPAEVAAAVAFLAGPDASAVTGVTLPVDAGWLVAPTWQTYGGIRREHPSDHPSEAGHA